MGDFNANVVISNAEKTPYRKNFGFGKINGAGEMLNNYLEDGHGIVDGIVSTSK